MAHRVQINGQLALFIFDFLIALNFIQYIRIHSTYTKSMFIFCEYTARFECKSKAHTLLCLSKCQATVDLMCIPKSTKLCDFVNYSPANWKPLKMATKMSARYSSTSLVGRSLISCCYNTKAQFFCHHLILPNHRGPSFSVICIFVKMMANF